MAMVLVGEDDLCCALGAALISQSGAMVSLDMLLSTGGAGPFRSTISRMNEVAAAGNRVLMVGDADQAACVVTQIRDWSPNNPSENLLIRLAVREAESWVLADEEGLAAFAKVSEAKIPPSPDELADPKADLLRVIRGCKRGDLKREMLPSKVSSPKVGLGYNLHLKTFVREHWRADRAARRSPSLARALPKIYSLLARSGQ